LTGGIGSGKSTVAAMLVARGATLVDTDAIARSLTSAGGLAMPMLIDEFGAGVADAEGALDRARMRELVFSDSTAKRRLESILHPAIGQEAQRQAASASTRVVVFDVPLLTESSHWRSRCERILVVDCHAETQVRRVVARSGWSEEQVRNVLSQQASRERRRAIADAVLFNDGLEIDALSTQVARLWSWWFGPDPVL
jgi:dephospho-CoA kinase